MTTILDRQKEFTRYLVAGFPEYGLRGWSFKGACAVTGNGSVENKMLPVTTGRKDHGSDAVLQWRLDRLDGPNGLRAWARSLGIPWDTLRTQAAFTLWETAKDYPALDNELREGKKSIETLTANFMNVFERPNKDPRINHLDLRISHAKSVYLIMKPEFTDPEVEKPKASAGAKVGGAIVATGASAAGANVAMGGDEMTSVIVAAGSLLAGAVSWLAPKIKTAIFKPRVETPTPKPPPMEEARTVVLPVEIIHSDTAAFDAANAHVMALEAELESARAEREKERMKVIARAKALLSAIAAPSAVPAPAIDPQPAADAPDPDLSAIQGLS